MGSYRLLELLGEGGMGRVYLAEHALMGRRVAIKLLRTRFARNPTAIDQFFQEARAVNAIRHPAIVDIMDFVVFEGGAYCVMEYLQGESLADLIRREGAPLPTRSVRIIQQICSGLQAAHEAGFAHLDIKPSNIFLQREGALDRVKLLDFGASRLVGSDLEAGSPGSHDSNTFSMWTPAYMSPEQARGQELDHRSDLYSLGVVIHELLTGRPPFTARSATEYLYKHIAVKPDRISRIQGVPHKVPRAVTRLVAQCLEKDPGDRPQSAAAIGAGIQPILGGQSASGGPGVNEDMPRYPARRWAALGISLGAAVAVVLGGDALMEDAQLSEPSVVLSLASAEGRLGAGETARVGHQHVVLDLASGPSGAEVELLDGERRILGKTPLRYRIRLQHRQVAFRVTRPGYQPRTVQVVPDSNKSYRIDLDRRALPAERGGGTTGDGQRNSAAEPESRAASRGRHRARDRRARHIVRRGMSAPQPRTKAPVNTLSTVDPFR